MENLEIKTEFSPWENLFATAKEIPEVGARVGLISLDELLAIVAEKEPESCSISHKRPNDRWIQTIRPGTRMRLEAKIVFLSDKPPRVLRGARRFLLDFEKSGYLGYLKKREPDNYSVEISTMERKGNLQKRYRIPDTYFIRKK